MADSLGIGQIGSPNIGDLISLITDNIDHVYTISGSANMNTSKDYPLTQTYRAFLVWYTSHTGGSVAVHFNGFLPIKAGSQMSFASMTATFAENSINMKGTSTAMAYLDLTLVGII